jgi:putative ABC transport system permease protein
VAVVLLIGRVNIAGLLVGRLESRSRELALRQSLGGGRAAVARQLLTESVILALCGGTAGVVIGYGSLVALRGLLREGFAIWQPIDLDLRALAVTAAVSIGCGLVLGFYPAWQESRSDLRSVLDQGDRGVSRRGVSWSRELLVVAQLSACLLLLAGADLTIRTFDALRSLEPGFDPRGVVVAAVSLDDARYASAKSASRLFEAVLSR